MADASFPAVKGTGKTVNGEPIFDKGLWKTPIVIAIFGIVAALCALVLR